MLRLCACGPCRKTIMTSRIKHDYKITQRCLATKPFFLPLYFWRATRINFFATTSMNVCVALCNYRQVKALLWRVCDALLTSNFSKWRTWAPISLSDDSGEELAAVVAFLRVLVIVCLEIVRSCNLEKIIFILQTFPGRLPALVLQLTTSTQGVVTSLVHFWCTLMRQPDKMTSLYCIAL